VSTILRYIFSTSAAVYLPGFSMGISQSCLAYTPAEDYHVGGVTSDEMIPTIGLVSKNNIELCGAHGEIVEDKSTVWQSSIKIK
jgi:hypothetical protein